MDLSRPILMITWQFMLILLSVHRPIQGGFLFFASPGYDGLKKAGLWGGFINDSHKGKAQNLYSQGFQQLQLPSFFEYEGMQINTLSYDPRGINALVEVEEVHRGLTVVGKGQICPEYGPFIAEEPELDGPPMTTLIPDVVLMDSRNPFLMDRACGWKCGWGGFALHSGRVYFILSAVFGYRLDSLKRKIQIRVLNSNCDELLQKAIKYQQTDVEFPVLQCSDHIVDVYEHEYVYGSAGSLNTWIASPLKVILDSRHSTLYFVLQVIQKAECDVTMSLVRVTNVSHQTVWIHNQSLPSIYGGNAKIRGFGSMDYREGVLCWTAGEVLLCGPIAGDQVSLVSMLLPPGIAHSRGICSGELPFAKGLTGVAVASATPLRVYFGCYSELPGHGGAGLVEVNLSSANEVVKYIYSVQSGGKKVYASNMFHVDNLCGPCTRDCGHTGGSTGQNDQTTRSAKLFQTTTSGVMTSRSWLEGSPKDGALTGAARTLVTTFPLILYSLLVLAVIL